MKKVILFLALITLGRTTFAMHAEGDDSCIARTRTGVTLQIGLAGGQPYSPHILIEDRGPDQDARTVLFKNVSLGDVDQETNNALALQSLGDQNLKTQATSDGCYEGQQATSNRTAIVLSVDSKVAAQYGLKVGDKLSFSCTQSYSSPSGASCDQ